MIFLSSLVIVLIAQQIVRPPVKTNAAPYVQTGFFTVTGTGFITTTITFWTAQPDS